MHYQNNGIESKNIYKSPVKADVMV